MGTDEPPRLKPDMASFRLLVLAFVRDYLEKNGASPSYGEVAAALSSGRTRVKLAIRSLAAEGLLLRKPGPRGLALPTMRDEAIRQLRELGWTVDEDIGVARSPGTNPSLLPPPELTYPAPRIETESGDGEQANEQGGARAA